MRQLSQLLTAGEWITAKKIGSVFECGGLNPSLALGEEWNTASLPSPVRRVPCTCLPHSGAPGMRDLECGQGAYSVKRSQGCFDLRVFCLYCEMFSPH